MRYRKPPIIDKYTCGKIDRCKHAVTCPYGWQITFSGLCFERKPEPNYARKRKEQKNEKQRY